MASEEKKVDVLILGAGLSGLAAAYQLSKKVPSLTFLVAEANDRVGGRTLTMHLKGPQGQKDAFDLGAHWVCRRQKDIMSLIEDLRKGNVRLIDGIEQMTCELKVKVG